MKNLIVLMSIFVLVSISGLQFAFAEMPTTETDSEGTNIDGYNLIAENSELRLYSAKSKAAFIVENKATGYQWSSSLNDDEATEGFTDAQIRDTKSLLRLTYTSVASLSSKTTVNALEDFDYELETSRADNGLIYSIYIGKLDCRIDVSVVLDEYGLKVSIPIDGIEESVQLSSNISETRAELLEEIESIIKTYQEKYDSNATSSAEKKQLKVSLEYLAKINEIAEGMEQSLDIGSTSSQITEYIDLISKTGYKSPQLTYLKQLTLNIQETDASAIVAIELLPYFGACGDSEEGYFLYPDGSGALTYIKENHSEFKNNYSSYTYSDMNTDISKLLNLESEGIVNQTIPYFGAKIGNDAFIAYVSSGKEMSNITFSPSGYNIPVPRASAGFTYRLPVATSSADGEWQSGSDTMVYEADTTEFEASVEYQFLEGESANYSGMANKLREYMLGEGILAKSELVDNSMPLALDFLGAINEKYLFVNRYMIATEIKQAEAAVNSIEDVPILLNYKGITTTGYDVYPAGYKLNSKLGSEEDMKQLAETLESRNGKLFIDSNQLIVEVGEGDYKQSELTIGNQFTILSSNDDDTKFLLSPTAVNERKSDLIEQCVSYGNAAILENMLAKVIFKDYSKSAEVSRIETVERWKENLSALKSELGVVGVTLGNDYILAVADWVKDVPVGASGYIFTDEEVPFYEMLTHGYIAETGTFFNEFYDEEEQFLKSIEYGVLPYYNVSVNAIERNSKGIQTSTYDEIYEDIVSSYNEYSQAMGDLANVPIVGHSKSDELVTVIYENGVKILLNYSDHVIEAGGVEISPKSYVRVRNDKVDLYEENQISIQKIENDAKGGTQGVTVYSALVLWLSVVLLISALVFSCISIFKHNKSEEF